MSIKKGLSVFLHIPKTGGTTLHSILGRHYQPEQMLHVSSVKTPLREEAEKRAQQEAPFLIKGHLNIGEVKDIPGTFVFTFLREPVRRVISHYFFLKATPSVAHYEFLNRPDTTIESFYALAEKKDIDNCLTRFISGCHTVPFGQVNEENYRTAVHHLHHSIDFFGMTDRYDESLIRLSGLLGLGLPVHRPKNITRVKESVSADTIDFLREANRWDILLYDEAKKIFSERMKNMSAGEKRKLSLLRVLNKAASFVPF